LEDIPDPNYSTWSGERIHPLVQCLLSVCPGPDNVLVLAVNRELIDKVLALNGVYTTTFGGKN
jgi:hypothetical protein